MGKMQRCEGTAAVLPIVVVALSVLWMLVRPDMWVWALVIAIVAITMLRVAYKAGERLGRESAMSAERPPETEKPAEKTTAEAQLEAFRLAVTEANLFAYELKHGLVPDGNTADNPGYGPMDFNEWREWKQREFERTGNPWHNHPGGVPPKKSDAA